MTNDKLLQKQKLYHSDRVAYLLIEKLDLSPLTFGLLSIAIATALYLLTAWVSNTLWFPPQHQPPGLLQDWLPWVLILLINPVVLGYYLWSFGAINDVIKELEKSDLVKTDKSKQPNDEILQKPEAPDRIETEKTDKSKVDLETYSQQWQKFLALASAVCFSIFVFSTRSGLKNSWTGSGFLPKLIVTISTFVVVYIGSMLVLNLITNVRVLHRILGEKNLEVNPLHPDRCGGLRTLSDYSLKTSYLAAVLGIMVGLIEYQFITQGVGRVYWFAHLIIPLHVILSIACFFGPLLAAHRGMKKAKEGLLHEIARQFQADYSQIHTSLTGDAEMLKKGSEKIKELRAFYTLTDEFPV